MTITHQILQTGLCLRAMGQLLRYDLIDWTAGFKGNYENLKHLDVAVGHAGEIVPTKDVTRAFERACALYWKPVLCLHRSIAEARLLRCCGWRAEVVIGYRAAPFAGHAWVEVEGVAAGDSRGYQKQLLVLERIGATSN